MMLYPTITDLLKKVDNRYMLVNLTARRAREIAGRADEAGEKLEEKPVKMAINDINEGRTRGTLRDGFQSAAKE